jgi:hypothetical protein
VISNGSVLLFFVSAALLGYNAAASSPVAASSAEGAALAVSTGVKAALSLLDCAQTGVCFTNTLSDAAVSRNQILMNGSGVAAGDVDGDGWCDLYFCGLENSNRLFRNLGNWRFADWTAESGTACAGQHSTGAAFADTDGDGDLDLIVNSAGAGTRIFANDGKGHFRTSQILNSGNGGMSLALADVDGDGDLDLYIANYRAETVRSTGLQMLLVNGRRMLKPEDRARMFIAPDGKLREFGEPDVLCINEGKGRFAPASWTDGRFLDESGNRITEAPKDWGLTVLFRDLNGDAAPDIYVCNDFWTPDRLWINQGEGSFRAASPLTLRNSPTFSMSADFADINRDGSGDLIAADMLDRRPHVRLVQGAGDNPDPPRIGDMDFRPQVVRNTLQLGREDGTFSEIANCADLASTGWTWSFVFLDVDLDGYEDLLVSTGNLFDTQDLDANERIDRGGPYSRQNIPKKLLMYSRLPAANLAFRNLGNLRFEEVGKAWGFDWVGISHGMCLADLDNDGDMDVVVNNLNAPAGIYRNEGGAPRVAVRLKGAGANTRGIGAKIKLLGGPGGEQSQEMISGGRYLSSDEPMRSFAAGTNPMRLEVTWRGGRRSVAEGMLANHVYEIAETNTLPAAKPAPAVKPLFEDATGALGHQHHEEGYDDFARQALLPRRLSQPGPGVSWIQEKGKEALAIGSGQGGALSIHAYDRGAWTLKAGPKEPRDLTTILGSGGTLLAGSANYEDGLAKGSAVRGYTSAGAPEIIPANESSTGPLALGDIDGDGQLELFVGGRVIPGRYPEAASSRIFRQRSGKWQMDEENTAILKEAGLVSGALWSDLSGDGYPELILACEWGPLKIFANDKGHLREATKAWGMDRRIGFWNGIAAGDFDCDGRMDLAASNWGLNTRYQVRDGHGPRLYYGRWGGSGEIEMIEAVFDPELGRWIPERDLNAVGRAIPWIREKFQTHRAYAEAGVEQILGEHLKEARVLEANWLETAVFLNRGDHFEAGALPLSAQFAPAFGISVADFDGNGTEDIFLAQNFFAVQPQSSRNDAGRGLLLKGNGKGGFSEVPGSESGIKIYGEQRGSAAGDYDGDGRTDLAVGQNGAATRLYHNVGGQPGLRVRLKGPAGNPEGIGAIIRVESGSKQGPAREVHAGSGYWSQDSAIQVMAAPEPSARIQVRWPGGAVQKISLSRTVREIRVDQATGTLGEIK